MELVDLDPYSLGEIFKYLDINSHVNLRMTCTKMNGIGLKSLHTLIKESNRQFARLPSLAKSNYKYSPLKCVLSDVISMCQCIDTGTEIQEDSAQNGTTSDLGRPPTIYNLLQKCFDEENFSNESENIFSYGNKISVFQEIAFCDDFLADEIGAYRNRYRFKSGGRWYELKVYEPIDDAVILTRFKSNKDENFGTADKWIIQRMAGTFLIKQILSYNIILLLDGMNFQKTNGLQATAEILYDMGTKSWDDHAQYFTYSGQNNQRLLSKIKSLFWKYFQLYRSIVDPKEKLFFVKFKYCLNLIWNNKSIDNLFRWVFRSTLTRYPVPHPAPQYATSPLILTFEETEDLVSKGYCLDFDDEKLIFKKKIDYAEDGAREIVEVSLLKNTEKLNYITSFPTKHVQMSEYFKSTEVNPRFGETDKPEEVLRLDHLLLRKECGKGWVEKRRIHELLIILCKKD